MLVKNGYVYYLQNPITKEIFYVGATTKPIKERLRCHYQHLKECDSGKRNNNRRFDYLRSMLPVKADIILIENVIDGDLNKEEIKHIEFFRNINPNLTNMTDGGIGMNTSKYLTEEDFDEYSKKISSANKGKPKPDGFGESMAIKRIAYGNPAAKEMKDPICCFKNGDPVMMFKYGFEINIFIGNPHGHGNVGAFLKRRGISCYGMQFKYLSECDNDAVICLKEKYISYFNSEGR